MPGIVGIVSHKPAEQCQRAVQSMVTTLQHEDFYISGNQFVPEMGIYAGWIAHENSFAAGQIFWNERKDITLVFSGECFVDSETLSDLRQKGHEFDKNNGSCLVHLYEEQDERFFGGLNGLFSGLLIDKRKRRAFLFNDRYGVERIYCYEKDGDFYFASEAKALLRILPETREFDRKGVEQFLTYQCTLAGRTMFRDIHILPGASLWSFENGSCRKETYFLPTAWESQQPLPPEAFEVAFEEALRRAMPRYFTCESQIGISLTGGLDTRMIMACRPQTAREPICYTFSGRNGLTLDDRIAARIARACGLEHQLLRIESDFFSDFRTHVDRTVFVTDGCFGAVGAHEIYLNKKARRLASVRLTGNYGSEILRGVSTFKPIKMSPDLFAPDIRRDLHCAAREPATGKEHAVTFAAFREIPWNLFGSIAAGRSQTIFRTPYLDNEIVSLAYRDPAGARGSRRAAWYVVKKNSSPLRRIPTDMGMTANNSGLISRMRQGFSKVTFKLDYLNNEGLPHSLSRLEPVLRLFQSIGILGLHKYLHYRSWFRRELAEYLRSVITDLQTQQSAFWNADFLEQMVREHIGGARNYVHEINAVLTLEAIERLLLRDRASR